VTSAGQNEVGDRNVEAIRLAEVRKMRRVLKHVQALCRDALGPFHRHLGCNDEVMLPDADGEGTSTGGTSVERSSAAHSSISCSPEKSWPFRAASWSAAE
jgi:hypothetical protein